MHPPTEPGWIKAYALQPCRLSNRRWIWLRSYEWRWSRPASGAPMAVHLPRIERRLVP